MHSRRPKRIVIVTGAHLCRNPRVVKEATALGVAGYDVTVVAPLMEDALVEIDAEILAGAPFSRIVSTDVRESQGLRGRIGRAVRRLANEINARTGRELADELGYGVRSALRKARALDADLYIGHQEVGAWIVWKLMYEGRLVAADLEDWYSRDLLPEAQRGRPTRLLDKCEGDLVRRAAYTTTTSEAMAASMNAAYGRRPEVIYNAFPWADRNDIDGLRKDRINDDRPSLFWFSQTIGPGRGLEVLVDALKDLDRPVQIHLRGNVASGYDQILAHRLGIDSAHSLSFHPLVPPCELLSRIAEHDIGLALEERNPPSRDLTITNKILQYLQAGLAVVATPTSGQIEVEAKAGYAVTRAESNRTTLAGALSGLLGSQDRLRRAKRLALEAAETTFSWEVQQEHLLRHVATALVRTSRE